MNWKENLIDSPSDIRNLIRQTQRIAVLGIKTEAQADQPAFYVPKYLVMAGFEVMPVPVYYPEVMEILGKRVYRRLMEIAGNIDLVDVFRRSQDIDAHVEDILAKKPTAVWFQSGIRNDAAAETLAKAGIKVVQDRCLMVEHRLVAKGSHQSDANFYDELQGWMQCGNTEVKSDHPLLRGPGRGRSRFGIILARRQS
jgi:predicted CoA-binding protein